MKKVFLFTAILLVSAVAALAQTVSVETLLKEMADREGRACFPYPEFTCRQFSSYDRASVARDEPGWFANWDCTNFLGVDHKEGRIECVMMDTEGPGAIVRFWMTFAGNNSGRGTMRIYIDDMETPAIEGTAFDILSGGLVAPEPLSSSVSPLTRYEHRGHNLYFPIPYSKRCKITYQSENLTEDENGVLIRNRESVYYNINYRTYDPGINVVSWSAAEMKRNAALTASVCEQLSSKDRGLDGKKLGRVAMNCTLEPGASKTFTVTGAKALRHLGMKLAAADMRQALRSTVVGISFDGNQTVWAPLGDFFCTGYMPLDSETWYTKTSKDGRLDAWWVMPFRKECRITLHNYGQQAVTVGESEAATTSWKWDKRSMYFGSAWHQYSSIRTGGPKTMNGSEPGPVDLNFVTLTGKGVYVGDAISLFNTTYAWWGEGDEKVYVDGEKFPSHFGTGTEDYYGYAWCRPEPFTGHPFIGQPCGTGNFDPAYSTNTRVRILDAIPFDSSIEFDMELWHWADGLIDYAPVTFWYMMPGGSANYGQDIASVQRKVATSRSDLMPERTFLTLEGEALNPVARDGGAFEYLCAYPEKLSGGMQMFWHRAAVGQQLTVDFDNDFEFNGPVSAIFSMDRGSASVSIYLNGVLLKKNLDLYSPSLRIQEIHLGEGALHKGRNTLRFVIEGLQEGAKEGYIGIDKIIFGS